MNEDEIQQKLNTLISNVQSMQMATLGKDGSPEVSYAPFVKQGSHFYLFLSDLAKHSGNLQREPKLNFMLIEDEAETRQIFARTRLICKADTSIVPADIELYKTVLTEFETKFGSVMNVLQGLSDFKLFELQITEGSFVMGFGQAYSFTGSEFQNLTHLRENR